MQLRCPGTIIFLNNTLILAYSKHQNTVGVATFGAEFVATRIAKDLIVALRLKLVSFKIRLDRPADVHCNNTGVYRNTMCPRFTLTKKHNEVNYHAVRVAVARGIMRVCKEDTLTNITDSFTKLMSHKHKTELLGFLELI